MSSPWRMEGERGNRVSVSALSAGAYIHCNFVRDGNRLKAWKWVGVHPLHPHQPGLIFPSWWYGCMPEIGNRHSVRTLRSDLTDDVYGNTSFLCIKFWPRSYVLYSTLPPFRFPVSVGIEPMPVAKRPTLFFCRLIFESDLHPLILQRRDAKRSVCKTPCRRGNSTYCKRPPFFVAVVSLGPTPLLPPPHLSQQHSNFSAFLTGARTGPNETTAKNCSGLCICKYSLSVRIVSILPRVITLANYMSICAYFKLYPIIFRPMQLFATLPRAIANPFKVLFIHAVFC